MNKKALNIKFFIILGIVFFSKVVFSQESEVNKHVFEEEGYILFPKCEVLTQENLYACNIDQLRRFVYNQITYPVEALDKGIEGKVIIKYSITSEGKINSYVDKEKTNADPILSLAALKIMENLTDSINLGYIKIVPQKLNENKINTYYRLPIHFKLPEKKGKLNESYQRRIVIATYRTIEKTVEFRKDVEGNIYAYLLLPDKSEKLLITINNTDNSNSFTEEELSYMFLYNLTFLKSEILLTTGKINNKEYEIYIDKNADSDKDHLKGNSSNVRINIYSLDTTKKLVDVLFSFEQLFNSPYGSLLFK